MTIHSIKIIKCSSDFTHLTKYSKETDFQLLRSNRLDLVWQKFHKALKLSSRHCASWWQFYNCVRHFTWHGSVTVAKLNLLFIENRYFSLIGEHVQYIIKFTTKNNDECSKVIFCLCNLCDILKRPILFRQRGMEFILCI